MGSPNGSTWLIWNIRPFYELPDSSILHNYSICIFDVFARTLRDRSPKTRSVPKVFFSIAKPLVTLTQKRSSELTSLELLILFLTQIILHIFGYPIVFQNRKQHRRLLLSNCVEALYTKHMFKFWGMWSIDNRHTGKRGATSVGNGTTSNQ